MLIHVNCVRRSDGSFVFNVVLEGDRNVVTYEAISEEDAVSFAEAVQATATKHTNTIPAIRFNY